MNKELIEIITNLYKKAEKHRELNVVTCEETCWCWDAVCLMNLVEQEKNK